MGPQMNPPPLRPRRFTLQWLQWRGWSGVILGTMAIASTGLIGCNGNDGEDNADLNAILKDGDLTLLNRGALSLGAAGANVAPRAAIVPVPLPARTGAAGTAPNPTGAAGAMAASDGGAGVTFDGGGAAGTFGTGTAGVKGFGGDMGGGGAGPIGPFPQSGQGLWQFDDCSAARTDLGDSSFNGHTAFRAVSAACATGVQGQGISIDQADDLVYVPDQPTFTFENGVTAAAWVKPTRLGGVRTILRKREDGTSTFVLLANDKTYQFVIHLANGRAADVSAKATPNVFTHVAGTYDGHDLRLYLNGKLAAHTKVTGRLSAGAGPVLMGNDALARRLDGVIDNVFFDTSAATADQVVRLNCLPRPSTLVAVPASSPPVAAGTEVDYDVQLTNNTCDPESFQFNAFPENGASLTVNPSFDFRTVASGTTEHIALAVSSSVDTEPDDYPIDLSVFDINKGNFLSATATYSVLGGPCSIRSRKEIEIRDLSVVEDPVRTAPGGAWTFQKLMEAMAPTPAAAPDMVEGMLDTWLTDQTVNGFTVAARPSVQDTFLTPFPRTPDGKLDLSQAPLRLLAIANRVDLQDVSKSSAGEGRFVFGMLDPFGNPLQMTMILEYNIPAAKAADVTALANAWHGLSSLAVPSEAYNAALQAITDKFATRNAAPGRVNGSAIGQIRTNDFFVLGEWEFREFHLSAAGITPAGLALTPDRSFNFTDTLSRYINANESSILTQTHTVPATFEGQPFQAGSMITDFFTWQPPGVNPEAREKFALNTCNGCHTSPLETNTFVFQVSPRSLGQTSQLSPFLLGTQVNDPFSNSTRIINELGRRSRILHDLVCPNDPLPPPPPDNIPNPGIPDGGFPDDGGFAGSFGGTGAAGAFGSDAGVSTGFAGTSGTATGAAGTSGGTFTGAAGTAPFPPPKP
jgi:Concanavalin A-like lectin/glucanases superfamily